MTTQIKPGDSVVVEIGRGLTKHGSVQRLAENTVYVKHYNGSVVGYKPELVTPLQLTEQARRPYGVGLQSEFAAYQQVLASKQAVVQESTEAPTVDNLASYVKDLDQLTEKKHLTPAELKKREEVAKAIERDNPGMDTSKKMAIATATAKKVAESVTDDDTARTAHMYGLKHGREGVGNNMDRAKAEWGDNFKHYNAGFLKGRNEKAKGLKAVGQGYGAKPKNEEVELNSQNEEVEQFDEQQGVAEGSEQDAHQMALEKLQKALKNPNVPAEKKKEIAKQIEYQRSKLKQGVKESVEDMHYCAKHVFSERFGEGLVVEGSHAEPDENGLIEWYDVDFGGTVRRVMTEKVKVMHAEYHMNHKKKKMSEEEAELDEEQIDEAIKRKLVSGSKVSHQDHGKGTVVMVTRGGGNLVPKDSAIVKFGNTKKTVKVRDLTLHEEKPHTIPKTAKEKDLAALAEPKDKITHADVMVGRGVKKEESELEEESMFGLYRKGGSVGEIDAARKRGALHSQHGVLISTHNSAEEAKEKAKSRNSSLSAGEKAAYKMKYHVKPIKEESELEEGRKADELEAAKAEAREKHERETEEKRARVARNMEQPRKKSMSEAMISYSDFQSKLDAHKKAGNKIKDDKYDKNKASYTVIDQDGVGKKITHTPSGTKQDHLGQVEKAKETEQSTETRGRGRPAGSKSGARN